MKISKQNLFCRIDKFCDKIPFISSMTNLVDLIAKAILKVMGSHSVAPLAKHLEQKSIKECCILLVPVFGNIYIYRQNKKPEEKNKFVSVIEDTLKFGQAQAGLNLYGHCKDKTCAQFEKPVMVPQGLCAESAQNHLVDLPEINLHKVVATVKCPCCSQMDMDITAFYFKDVVFTAQGQIEKEKQEIPLKIEPFITPENKLVHFHWEGGMQYCTLTMKLLSK